MDHDVIPPVSRRSAPPRTAAPALPAEAPGQLRLRPGEVDVWVARVADHSDADLAAPFDHVLSDDERHRHAKFLFAKDRRRYLVTRSLVRYVLSRYVPIRPAEWRFAATAFGRPFVVNQHPGIAGLTFNISHSDQVVLLGVTRESQLGVDVEDLRRSVPIEMADSFFSAGEIRQLRSLPPALQPQCFLDFWTLKESYIKARGKGLSLPLDQFGFELGPERQLQAYFDPRLDDSPRNWTFWQWYPSQDSIAALCVENRPGIQRMVTVRRTVPFVLEERVGFDVLRTTSI